MRVPVDISISLILNLVPSPPEERMNRENARAKDVSVTINTTHVIPSDSSTTVLTSYISSTPLIDPNSSETEKIADIPQVQMATVSNGAIIEKIERRVASHLLSSP